MKRIISLFIVLMLVISLTACNGKKDDSDVPHETITDKSNSVDDYGGEPIGCFSGIVLEVSENTILVEPDAESNEAKSSDKISVSVKDISVSVEVGDRVVVDYKGDIAESYPAQINNVVSVEVIYDWGIALSVKNITLSGLTLVCTQSGGEIKGEINTGEDYFLEVMTDNGWEKVPTVIEDYAWDSIAYMVTLDGTTVWDVNWSWLYGELENGTYRLGKGFMDFRETGDYDTAVFYAEFVITDDTVQTSIDLVICD